MIKRNLKFWVLNVCLLAIPFAFSEPRWYWAQVLRKLAANDVVAFLPYLLFAAVGFLSFQMSLRKVTFACAYLMGVLWFSTHGVSTYSWQILLLSAPLTLGAVFFMKQGKLFGKDGALLLAATVIPPLAVYGFQNFFPAAALNLYRFTFVNQYKLTNVPQISLALAAVFFLTPLFQSEIYLRRLHRAFVYGLLPLYFVVEKKPASPMDLDVAFGAYGLLAFAATLRVYLQKIYMDELTGIPNRRALNEALARLSGTYTIAMVDIDHFKKFNDTHGHDHGDNVLKMVGQHVFSQSGGLAYRYGGEEFTMLFENKSAEEVYEKVDKIRASLAERKFFLRDKPVRSPAYFFTKFFKKPQGKGGVKVTISIGVATGMAGKSTDEVFKAADECLYKAKEKGRNCVVLFQNQKLKAS